MLQIELWKRVAIWLTIAVGLLLALPNVFYGRVELSNDAEAALAEDAPPLSEAKLVEMVQKRAGFRPAPDMPVMLTEGPDGTLVLPEGTDTEALLRDMAGLWPSFLPDGLVHLGLDLRGGAQLLVEVQVEDVYASRMDALWPAVRDVLAAERDTVGFVTREDSPPDELWVRVSNAEGLDEALSLVRGLAQPVASLTAAGQTDLVVRAEGGLIKIALSEAEKAATDDRTVRQALEVIRRRIDEVGTREPAIQRQGANRILVQVPGVGSAQEVKDLIGTTAQLTFHPVVGRTSDPTQPAGSGNIILPSLDEPGTYYILERTPVVTGEELVDAQPAFDQYGRPSVNFRFNPTGARAFGEYTSANVGALFAIVLDDEVISAPQIRQAITGGSGQITGRFTVEESTELAVLLRAGALPADLVFLEERTIGPELGRDSIEAGTIACIVALAAVLVFMALSYGRFGLYANGALLINIGLIFGLLSLIGATLTLPGIAGIVLTIGMAVDANVLIFERIREELKTARGPARAIELGYEKALSAIIDANITTLITAVILYAMGSGPVRGFAITLGLGIITSVFTAIFVTRLFVVMWFERRRPRTIEV